MIQNIGKTYTKAFLLIHLGIECIEYSIPLSRLFYRFVKLVQQTEMLHLVVEVAAVKFHIQSSLLELLQCLAFISHHRRMLLWRHHRQGNLSR